MSEYYTLQSDWESQNQVALSTQDAEAGRFTNRLAHIPGLRDDPPFLQWQMPSTGVFDWPWNDGMVTLLSDRARVVIEPLLGAGDHVQWIPASMRTLEGAFEPYWVAHFYEPLDVYHDTLTDRGPSGIPMTWTVSLAKAAGHHVFVPPHMSGLIILSSTAADAVRAADLTGVTLTPCASAW